jgi:hypothetical protein
MAIERKALVEQRERLERQLAEVHQQLEQLRATRMAHIGALEVVQVLLEQLGPELVPLDPVPVDRPGVIDAVVS